MPGLEWRLAALVPAGRNVGLCNGRVGLSAGGLDYLAEYIFPLASTPAFCAE
jgi:hypothetical protein